MKEAEARDSIEPENLYNRERLQTYCKGYLEAIEKAKMLEECIDGLICGTCDAETAEEVLKKWRREK